VNKYCFARHYGGKQWTDRSLGWEEGVRMEGEHLEVVVVNEGDHVTEEDNTGPGGGIVKNEGVG
jgi:hypothetical protein